MTGPTAGPMTGPMTGLVLVAEDEALIMALVRATLAPLDVEVREAVTGTQALDAALAEPPDLVLLDVGLPELDGYQVCRALKTDARTSRVPVVLLTARAQPGDRDQGYACGADDFVTKPFSPHRLRAEVERILGDRSLGDRHRTAPP